MKQRLAETEEVVELTPEEIDGDGMLHELGMSSPRRGELMTQRSFRIEDTFDLSPEEEADLDAAIAEADAGLLVPLEDVLRRMRETSETKH